MILDETRLSEAIHKHIGRTSELKLDSKFVFVCKLNAEARGDDIYTSKPVM